MPAESTVETVVEAAVKRPAELRPQDVAAARGLRQHGATWVAFAALLSVDVLLKGFGFARFHRFLSRFSGRLSRCRRQAEGESARKDAAEICAAVDRASTWYFKRAWCLQRSAAAVCLLRWRGLAAELVIGLHKMPFYAHAWVEIGGQVINDHPVVQERYTVVERC